MRQFRIACSEHDEEAQMVAECLQQLGQVSGLANLGFLYCSDFLAERIERILHRLKDALPGIRWVGTVGMGICAGDREIYDQAALAIMVGEFPADSFQLLREFKSNLDQVGIFGSEQPMGSRFAFIHADPTDTRTAHWLEQLANEPAIAFVNGGVSSSRGANPRIAGTVVGTGLSGVIFNAQVSVTTDHTQGCQPIGPVHHVTKANSNIAITLDNQPALEVLKTDVGEVLSKDLRRLGGYIFAALPIQGSDTGDYLVRNLIGIDKEQQLVAVGDRLQSGQRLIFCRRDGNSAREDMVKMLLRMKKRVGERLIRGGIYVTCLGRGRHQFGENSEELKLITQYLGEFPLIGYFANGEIYNGRLYGYTGVLTLFL